MQDLLLIFAGIMPFDELINQLDESIKEYRLTQSDDSRKKIEMYSHMIAAKSLVDMKSKESGNGNTESIVDLIKEMDEAKKAMTLLKPGIH